jgi:tetratricopeptide (TPR) repeat protein
MVDVRKRSSPKAGEQSMFCIRCGKRNPDEARFCKQCGAPITSLDDETQPLPAPAPEVAAVPDSPKPSEPATLAGAYARIAAGDCAAAIDDCSALIAAEPSNRDAHALLSTLLEQTGDLDAAVLERAKVVELAPDSAIDRDKLTALRAAAASLDHPPRRTGIAALFESPASAAVTGVAVTLFVLFIGAGIIWMRGGRMAQEVVPPSPPDIPSVAYQAPAAAPRVLVNPGVVVNPQAGTGTQAPGATAASPAPVGARAPGDTTGMAPARVISQPPAAIESDPRYTAQPGSVANGTVHLRDNDTPDNKSTASGDATSDRVTPPARDPGRIEIVVTNPGGGARPNAPKDANSAVQASQARRAYAQQQQVLGNFQEAIAGYRQALDGSGDDAPTIHQQLALCYQHLGDHKSAAAAYKEMIAGYSTQISAGRNVDAAKQGIKAAQLGLKSIQ